MRGPLCSYIDYVLAPAHQRPEVPDGFRWIDPITGQEVEAPSEEPDGPQYLVSWDLEEVSELADDFPQPYFMRDRNLLDALHPITRRALFNKHTWIFVGPAGSLSQLHNDHDHVHTYVAQVVGKKHFILISPADAHLVADVDYTGHTRSGRAADPLNPDLSVYPRFFEAEAYECTLQPGELLFFPGGWLHYAKGLSAGITVSKDSVDRHNFGRWFQSMAVDRLPKLLFRIALHKSFREFEAAPRWAVQLGAEAERLARIADALGVEVPNFEPMLPSTVRDVTLTGSSMNKE
jgi:hypothetical protein